MKRKITIPTIADFASIVGVALTVATSLYPDAKYYLIAVTVGLPAVCWILYSTWARLKRTSDLSKKPTRAPSVLLIGGEEYRSAMTDVTSDRRLSDEPYIQFQVVDDNRQEQLRQSLASADAAILMPDFTARSQPEIYRSFAAWCRPLPLPVVRYYPHNYAPPKSKDFPVLPFDTPHGVVEYASEFLLKRAVDRGRVLESKIRLGYWVTAILLVLFLTTLLFGFIAKGLLRHELGAATKELVTSKQEVMLFRKAIGTPATVQQEMAIILAEFRKLVVRADIKPERDQIKKLLAEWAKIQAEEIGRVSGNSDAKRLYIYVLSQEKRRLIPIVEYGAPGYTLDAEGSIAGCAFHRRLVVHWSGTDDVTDLIEAWSLRGDKLGTFDKGELLLERGKCRYDNEGTNDPKKQLLCLPIGVDDSNTTPPAPGVLCLSIDDNAEFISQEWLRAYLLKQSFAIGAIDLKALL